MTELRDRVVARLVTAQEARDPGPLREAEAVADALALLREAAPVPEGMVDLESVAAVFWTFFFRHLGDEDPEAQQNQVVVFGTFGFLCPRLPEEAGLPADLRKGFDPADPSHEARFAYLVSSAHGEAGELDRALAWAETALEYLLDEDHPGFVELGIHALGVHVARFQLLAEPPALAAAARYGRAVCERLPLVPPGAADVQTAAGIALRAVVDAARLLGAPELAVVERLVAAAPEGALTQETADGLNMLRTLATLPVTWPGERDLHIGAAIADAGIAEQDAARIACAVRRLRAARDVTPADHPAYPRVTAALGQALAAFAREREDPEAALEAAELVDSVGALGEEQQAVLAAYRSLETDESPEALGRFIHQVRRRQGDGPPDIDLEVLDLAAGFVPDDSADERIARFRTALPASHPRRAAHLAVLAALTGWRAETLRATAPARADLLAAESRQLTEAAGASMAADLLRRGLYEAALPIALASVHEDSLPDELTGLVRQMSRMNDVRLDTPENLESDIETMREMLADLDENDIELRPTLAAALASALSARASERGDPAALEEVVELVRYARPHVPDDLAGHLDKILADALTVLSIGRFDAEGAREAAALLASGAAGVMPELDELPYGDVVVTETDHAVLAARTEFHNAVQNYLFGHEPAQLERARQIARRMRDLIREAPATGGERPWYDLMGDVYVDLVETIGPGGGPRTDLDDSIVDQCRRTFAACPAGHPMRPMVTTTLARVLMQRAVLLRATEPERAAALVAEARELGPVIEEATPQGGPVDLAGAMRFVFDLVARGRLPEVAPGASAAQAREGSSSDLFENLMGPLRDRLAGTADPDAWRDRAVPVSMRAHGAIAAAAGALGRPRPRIDLALDHLEAGVEAMAAITDRGSDQQSAEHGLSTFEGDIRTIVELILMQLVGREVASLLPGHLGAVTDRLEAVAKRLETTPEDRREAEAQDVENAVRETAEAVQALPGLGRAVQGPEVDRAAELLERGRGLLLARRIEARADIGDLRSVHPALAAEFERLTDALASDVPDSGPAGHAEWARLAGLRASRELDALVDRIRSEPGFEDFLRPLTAPQLRELAADGPVVVLNQGRRFCQALVVTNRSITALHLDVESDEVAKAARELRDAVDAINAQGTARPGPARLVAAGRTVRETLAWTWHKVVRPVLELAGTADPVPRHGTWPRLWWVPTGAFSALPLHAAQCTAPDCEQGGCGAALDAVVSSYVPGLQTLAYARARARRRPGRGGALLVAEPEEELPGVAAATGYAAQLLGAPPPLIGTAATRQAVLGALHDASWAHFGCHAATDPTEPSGALLQLPSGEPVSVLEICRARPRAARLAFLAACGTARTAERLTDEAIHITSSFLLAGFPAAVGTLWTIDSTHADHMTRDFYRRTTAPDAPGAAHALHDTVRQLRRRVPERPHIWAAYVHAGT
ncbi:CHAT domain-containing protein [Streptomyces sp. NBC_00287]|uniref:CHAT domain-containing protein n=1 Tax=Streptomyces sp. NBC_00287 TaxID=2975702 RepID=UPI002E2CC84E|nr:CHAT domain-containing protein [Streptomyces sp. NBC_00287]